MMLYEANAELLACIAHEAALAFYEMIWFPTSMRYEMPNVPWSLVSVMTVMMQSWIYELISKCAKTRQRCASARNWYLPNGI
jgi:hypothetical protein